MDSGSTSVGNRIAQMVSSSSLSRGLDRVFLKDFYGYRPGKSALDAVRIMTGWSSV
jgi:RNA-directed DNA polymerase